MVFPARSNEPGIIPDEMSKQLVTAINRAQQDLRKVGHEGLPIFEVNCEIWLDPMLKEMDKISDAEFEVRMDGVHFVKYFRWHGIKGRVSSGPWGSTWKIAPPAVTWLEFYVPTLSSAHIVDQRMPRKITSPGDGRYTEVAEPVNPEVLEKLVKEVTHYIEAARRERENNRKREYTQMLQQMEDGFLVCKDVDDVQKYFAQVNTQQPDYSARWLEASKRRTQQILESQQAAEFVTLEESERKRLADQAAALFHPFTVYKLVLGILYPDEKEVRQFNRYVTTAVPDESAYYIQIRRGELINDYRPEAPIIELYRVIIDSPDHKDAPYVCRHVELVSDAVPHVTEHAFATPEGL